MEEYINQRIEECKYIVEILCLFTHGKGLKNWCRKAGNHAGLCAVLNLSAIALPACKGRMAPLTRLKCTFILLLKVLCDAKLQIGFHFFKRHQNSFRGRSTSRIRSVYTLLLMPLAAGQKPEPIDLVSETWLNQPDLSSRLPFDPENDRPQRNPVIYHRLPV